MRRSIPLAVSALSLATPTLLMPAEALAAKPAQSASSYRGPAENTGWGYIGVTITVTGKKLTAISTSVTQDTFPHSIQVNDYALPVLRQEALKAGSYKIHTLSGATQTSQAFIASLKSALNKAHI